MNENLEMHGVLTLQLTDMNGRLVHEQRCHNHIVTSGRMLVAQLFGGVTTGLSPTKVTHMAVGTDGTAAVDADPNLKAQRGPRNPIFGDVIYTPFDQLVLGSTPVFNPVLGPGLGPGVSPVVNPIIFNTVKRVRASLTAVFDYGEANGVDPLREAGIFTDATAGVMYNRVVFEPVTKTNAFKLTLLWDITF
jgi:hypothetical protein